MVLLVLIAQIPKKRGRIGTIIDKKFDAEELKKRKRLTFMDLLLIWIFVTPHGSYFKSSKAHGTAKQ
jgi:hypothetical protein